MDRSPTQRFWRAAIQLLAGGAGLALLTFACFRLGLDLTTAAFAYLILIVLLSLVGSFLASAILSIVAVGFLNYFFVHPLFQFRLDYPLDLAAITAFLTTSLLVSGLMTRMRGMAQRAWQGEAVQRELANLLDLTHDTVFVRDMRDVITYWNRGAAELYGWSQEEAVGQITHQLMQTIFPAPLHEINAELFRAGRWDGELKHTKRDGTQVVVASRWALQRDGSGNPVAILETNNDITERKRAEEERERLLVSERAALAEAIAAQQRFSDLVNSVEGIVWEAELSPLRFTFVSQQAERMLGYPVERWLSDPTFWIDHVHPDDAEWAVPFSDQATAEKRAYDYEYRMIAADGRVVWLRDMVTVVVEGDRPTRLRGVMVDFTERRQADIALRDSERRYRYIFDASGVSIWEEDFSRVKAAIDDLSSRGVRDFRQYLAAHPEFVRQAIAMVKIVDVNDLTVKLFAAESKDELLVSLDKVFTPEAEDVFVGELIALAEGRTSFQAETTLQTLKGDRLTVLFTITLPPPPTGLESVLVTVTDITDRRRSEEALRQAQAELAHVARVTTLGELTASIAHEVNQPLAAVVTNGEACLRFLGPDQSQLEEARGAVESMIKDAVRASNVIQRIRALSKKTDLQRTTLDVNSLINEVLILVGRELQSHRISLRLALTPDLPPVIGDRVQLQQVLINLLINAMEAMASVMDRPRDLVIRSLRDDGRALVTVVDSGTGIESDDMDRLFNAFFTTKLNGMGMGLSIGRSIIEAHDGRIWATRNAGPGMTFHVALPADDLAGGRSARPA
jgi:PAS domain S-box-containing protein